MKNKYYFQENGFVKLQNSISIEYIEHLNNLVDKLYVNETPDLLFEINRNSVRRIMNLHKCNDEFYNLAQKYIELANSYLDVDDCEIAAMQMIHKHPKLENHMATHQDVSYYFKEPKGLSVWIPLDDINDENGCIHYDIGTHKGSTLDHCLNTNDFTIHKNGYPIMNIFIDNYDFKNDTPVFTNVGDILVHHANVIHYSTKNISNNKRRRAICITYFSKSCKQNDKMKTIFYENLKKHNELHKNYKIEPIVI